MMVDNLPVMISPVPWIGDGASIGIGGEASDPTWGETEMITGAVLVQWPRVFKTPVPPKFIETARVPLYPGTPYATLIAKYPPVPVGLGDYADSQAQANVGYSGRDVDLGAPAIPS